MKTKNTPLFIARLALTLFVICAVVAILLALVNRVTAPRIETINAEKATKASRTTPAWSRRSTSPPPATPSK